MVIGNGSIGVISIAILLAVTACGGVEDTPRVQEQGTASEALAPKAGLTYWDANGSVVNICWTNSGLASEKDRIRTALQSTWDAYSGLTFTWPVDSNTTCPHTGEIVASTYLPIFVSDSSAFGGQCNAGFGARLDKSVCGGVMQCQCFVNTDFDSALTERSIEYAAMHEVAHGLGMIHEHQRADRPTDIASWCTDTNPDPNKWTTNPNYLIEPSLTVTVFDRTASVTSYCYDPDNDGVQNDPRVHPGGAYPELGVLDKLGIEMLHPFNLTRVPVAVGGIGDATGTT
jgi:hypothetical protein